MDDWAKFAGARLGEDGAAAKAATPGPWITDTEECCVVTADRDEVAERCQDESARHIARHDPARVLREVEAGRSILERHRQCGIPSGSGPCDEVGVVYPPCSDARDLLRRWDSHPDYRARWKP